ncbi:MAG: hypothetical protein ACXWNZ_10515 [Vulcanimicrobiaceae bacterium]
MALSYKSSSQNEKQPISYTIPHPGDPEIFAPRPISNVLQNRPNVGIRTYKTGSGLSKNVDQHIDFANIDMDVWGRQVFGSIDGVLAPEFTGPAQIVDHYAKTAHLADTLAQNERLAAVAAQWMIPAFATTPVPWDPTIVREAFRQYMLERLSNAYATRAGVQFAASPTPAHQLPVRSSTPRSWAPRRNLRFCASARSLIRHPRKILQTTQSPVSPSTPRRSLETGSL